MISVEYRRLVSCFFMVGNTLPVLTRRLLIVPVVPALFGEDTGLDVEFSFDLISGYQLVHYVT